jgi:hypothetical protein
VLKNGPYARGPALRGVWQCSHIVKRIFAPIIYSVDPGSGLFLWGRKDGGIGPGGRTFGGHPGGPRAVIWPGGSEPKIKSASGCLSYGPNIENF